MTAIDTPKGSTKGSTKGSPRERRLAPERKLGSVEGGLRVPALGLGCMGMSEFYGAHDDAESLATLQRSLELGLNFLDTADTYGLGHNEQLIGQLFKTAGRAAVTVASKFAIQRDPGAYARGINNDPAYVRAACEASLRRLGTDHIDLYYIHRVDVTRPIEEPMGELAKLVDEGKIRHVGLCEVNPHTLQRAHAVHPITALQTEYSLWSRDPEQDILRACRELGIGFVAYSPLGRGFLTGALSSTAALASDDFRRANPRFSDENLALNRNIVDALEQVATRKQCTAAQLALAWVLAQGEDIVPIPGTRRITRLEQNAGALDVRLSTEELEELDQLIPAGSAAGARYTEEGMKGVNA
jgi:aryl-alcohol dehydrogenase-like predicted oxidoreductase